MSVASWEPGTRYGYNDVVEYEGHEYKIIQPHTSQSDWTPPLTPALWGLVPHDAWESGEGRRQPEQQQQQQSGDGYQQQQGGDQGYHNSNVKPPPDYNNHPDQQVDVPHEEQKKNWWDLDEKRKHELEIGGGLAAGLAVLGAGYAAYHHHEKKSEEEQKAVAWGLQGWLKEAQQRTEVYRKNGPQGPTTWVLTDGHHIPHGALEGGRDAQGDPIFIARAFVGGGLQVGKASSKFKKGAAIGFQYKMFELDKYEILLGDSGAVHWERWEGNFDPQRFRVVEAGHEDNGSKLYIAQAEFHGATHPGKCGAHLGAAYIAFGGEEHEVKQYNVLVYN
ncbi:carbohydrate-binding module family 12 protein [Auriscalpium vulgare]|uniref:Carbohydrate-binding module family 12 protein n=1 Tax=Auriscalpium vulgare TaxID=40419 RepID=A0ACB8RM80_9AGAM|nr:carbohydrate-binding module family 12 protein [Auriscalpium vulgare]